MTTHAQDAPAPAPLDLTTGPFPGAATARAVIDLDAVAHNARHLAALAATPWMAVIKADAYGHGLAPLARTCLEAGATWLGTAQLAEALTLRASLDADGVPRPDSGPEATPTPHAPRLLTWITPVLTPQEAAAEGSPLRQGIQADLDLSVSTPGQLEALCAAAHAERHVARLHLKVDTGMSRAGAPAQDLAALAAQARRAEQDGHVHVVGLWSHLSRADEPASGSTQEHLARFTAAQDTVRAQGLDPRTRHLAATGGLLWHPQARLDLVRVGIGLYGLSPDPGLATSTELGLVPAMRLESRLAQVKRIQAGQAVSYGGTWRAPTDRWLGLVPLGYADGLPRAAASGARGPGAPGAPVWAAGLRTHVIGRVCMDQLVIDLGPTDPTDPDQAPARAGDPVILWGDPTTLPGVPSADDWAQACSTINYEIVTRLGPRVPRTYTAAAGTSRSAKEDA